MLNSLDIKLELYGVWHIAVIVNDNFLFYTTENTLSVPLDRYPAKVSLVFTGKNYNNPEHADNYCRIKNLYLNQLKFPYLIQQACLCSDNKDYKYIQACDYVNLNGTWQITIHSDTAQKQLEQLV